MLIDCSSSLQRIESSTIAIETDVKDIRNYLQPSLKSQTVEASAAPSLSAVDDEIAKLSLVSAMTKHTEIIQPWNTIGLDQWIQSGRWWLLRILSASSVAKQRSPAYHQTVSNGGQ